MRTSLYIAVAVCVSFKSSAYTSAAMRKLAARNSVLGYKAATFLYWAAAANGLALRRCKSPSKISSLSFWEYSGSSARKFSNSSTVAAYKSGVFTL